MTIQIVSRELTPVQICSYIDSMRWEERVPATIRNYLRDIHSFHAWLAGRPVTKELVAAWKAHLLAEGRAPVTVNAKLSALISIKCMKTSHFGAFSLYGWNLF